MDSKRDDDQVLESQLEQQQVSSDGSVESYPRLLSNQSSDVLDMLSESSSESSSETSYLDGQQYSQDDSGSAA